LQQLLDLIEFLELFELDLLQLDFRLIVLKRLNVRLVPAGRRNVLELAPARQRCHSVSACVESPGRRSVKRFLILEVLHALLKLVVAVLANRDDHARDPLLKRARNRLARNHEQTVQTCLRQEHGVLKAAIGLCHLFLLFVGVELSDRVCHFLQPQIRPNFCGSEERRAIIPHNIDGELRSVKNKAFQYVHVVVDINYIINMAYPLYIANPRHPIAQRQSLPLNSPGRRAGMIMTHVRRWLRA